MLLFSILLLGQCFSEEAKTSLQYTVLFLFLHYYIHFLSYKKMTFYSSSSQNNACVKQRDARGLKLTDRARMSPVEQSLSPSLCLPVSSSPSRSPSSSSLSFYRPTLPPRKRGLVSSDPASWSEAVSLLSLGS